MKKQTFIVTLTFESKISDDNDILDIAKNIARAIKTETNGIGIAPLDGDTYLENIEVKPQFLEEIITENVID
jgi:hypothetical protein